MGLNPKSNYLPTFCDPVLTGLGLTSRGF